METGTPGDCGLLVIPPMDPDELQFLLNHDWMPPEVPERDVLQGSGSYNSDLNYIATERQQADFVSSRVLNTHPVLRHRYGGQLHRHANELEHLGKRHDIDYGKRIYRAKQVAREFREYGLWHNYGKFHSQHKRKALWYNYGKLHSQHKRK